MAERERGERPPVNPLVDGIARTLADNTQGDYEAFSYLAKRYRTEKEKGEEGKAPQFIEALGKVIQGGFTTEETSPGAQADAVHLAYNLDLWEIATSVESLKNSDLYVVHPNTIKREVDNYFVYKEIFHSIPQRMATMKEFNALPKAMQDVFSSLEDIDTGNKE